MSMTTYLFRAYPTVIHILYYFKIYIFPFLITYQDWMSIKEISPSLISFNTTMAASAYKKYYDAFFTSFSLIIFSELGDKTFFVAAIMAMRHSKVLVFFGAAIALFIMTLLSAYLGSLATIIIPPRVTAYICAVLMYIFAFKMLYEAFRMQSDHTEDEIMEVTEEIQKRHYDNKSIPLSLNSGKTSSKNLGLLFKYYCKRFSLFLSGPFFQTMIMVFIGEWGDRSQLSTIILASNKNLFAVSAGAFIGHCLCTGFAVIGGNLLSSTVSVKAVTYIGACTFFFFGTFTIISQLMS